MKKGQITKQKYDQILNIGILKKEKTEANKYLKLFQKPEKCSLKSQLISQPSNQQIKNLENIKD